jgi:hypothetical protein
MCQPGPSEGRADSPLATISPWSLNIQDSYKANPREKTSAGGYLSLESRSSGAMYLSKENKKMGYGR